MICDHKIQSTILMQIQYAQSNIFMPKVYQAKKTNKDFLKNF